MNKVVLKSLKEWRAINIKRVYTPTIRRIYKPERKEKKISTHYIYPKAGLLGVVFLVGAVAVPLLPLHQPRTSASSVWMDGATITEVPIPGDPLRVNRANLECEYFVPKSKFVKGFTRSGGQFAGDVIFGDKTVESFGREFPDSCMVQNDHGMMSSSVWVPEGNSLDDAYPIDKAHLGMLPAPGGSAMLFTTPAPSYGMQYSISHNLRYMGKLDVRPLGTGSKLDYEKIWKIDISKISPFLTYGDGQIVRIAQVGFSNNGKFMVAQLRGRGMALINLYTKEMTPFLVNSIDTYANGLFMTVSNDGRYVAEHSTSRLYVHDLGGCQNKFSYGEWPSSGKLPTEGCQSSQDFFFSTIREAFPSSTDVARLRFSPNGASLYVDIGVSQSQGLRKRARLDAVGYVSQAKGYLAMGDSFSSGEGDTEGGEWYEPGTDEQGDPNTFAGRNLCHLSRRSYPYLLALETTHLTNNVNSPDANGLFHSVACSGAKTHNINGGVFGLYEEDGKKGKFTYSDNQYRYLIKEKTLRGWQPGILAQLQYTQPHNIDGQEKPTFNPEIITLGIGGNDADFGGILADCAEAIIASTCDYAIPGSNNAANLGINTALLKKRLSDLYADIKAAAPEARIYVHGYPLFIQPEGGHCSLNVRLNDAERQLVGYGVRYMNEVVKAAASEAGVFYVDVEDILVGANLCSDAPKDRIAVNGVTAGNDIGPGFKVRSGILGSESFHPRPNAHVSYADAILRQTKNLTAPMPTPQPTPIPVPNLFFGTRAIEYVNALNNNETYPALVASHESFIEETKNPTKMALSIRGLLPFSRLELTAYSTPTPLGVYTADEFGNLETEVEVPTSLEVGAHELHMYGFDSLGKRVNKYDRFVVGHSSDDFDGDGVADIEDSCSAITNSGIDSDKDGTDDACDAIISDPPVEPPVDPTPISPKQRSCNIRKQFNGRRQPKTVYQICRFTLPKVGKNQSAVLYATELQKDKLIVTITKPNGKIVTKTRQLKSIVTDEHLPHATVTVTEEGRKLIVRVE